MISADQAKELLVKFGPVQKAWSPSDTEQEMFGLPNGVFVRFTYYDHCQEALEVSDTKTLNLLILLNDVKGLRNDRTYHLQRKDDLAKAVNVRTTGRGLQKERIDGQQNPYALWIGSIQGDWATADVLRNFFARRAGSVSGAFVGTGCFGQSMLF